MEGDDFELETPDPLPRRQHARSQRPAKRGRWRVGPLTALAVGALLLALVMVLSVLSMANAGQPNTPPPTAQLPLPVYQAPAVPSGWATPNPTTIAPPPSCPPTTGTQIVTYLLAPALGVAPLWVAGFDQASARPVVHFESQLPRWYTLRGWAWQAIFATDLGYAGPITISGGGVGGHGVVTFGQGSSVVSALALDTRAPQSRMVSWGEWLMEMYLPGPGCYYVQARWPGGGWRVTFAAGR